MISATRRAIMKRIWTTLAFVSFVAATELNAQYTPAVQGATCEQFEGANCLRWNVDVTTLRYYAARFAGRTLRLRGVLIARCADQTLYFTPAAAIARDRSLSVQLFNENPALLNAVDSLTVVEIEGTYVGPYVNRGVSYAGALTNVRLLGTFERLGPDSITTADLEVIAGLSSHPPTP